MEVICVENEAFYTLIEEVVQRLKEKNNVQEDKWISCEEAMQKMRIKIKITATLNQRGVGSNPTVVLKYDRRHRGRCRGSGQSNGIEMRWAEEDIRRK